MRISWSRGVKLAGLAAAAALVAACAGFGFGGGPGPDGPVATGTADAAPEMPPIGREAIRRLTFPALEFDPPEPERFELSNGVTVFFLRDPTLPLVDVFVNVRGGYVHFDREYYGVAAGLLPLMRNGGTRTFTVDSLDAHVDFHALGLSTSMDGSRMILRVSGLRRQLDLLVELWSEILLRPRFDAEAVERWRVRELETVRRRADFPGSLAVQEFNRVLYGDHPTGWLMTEADLGPERITAARLRTLHGRTVCPEHAIIGAAGAVARDTLRAALEQALEGWEPCTGTLRDPPVPTLRPDRRVYVIHSALPQSTVVVGQPGGVVLEESSDYFASRVANWIIGGSAFTSRLMTRVRTEEGLAYSAASVWGTAREHQRILGAITHTGSDRTVDAARLVIHTLAAARDDPPSTAEVRLARDAIVNGFVFGFGNSAQVVARQVGYMADGLPADWLTRYFEGIRGVRTQDVARVIRRHLDPADFTVLIVGDTTKFDPTALGPVTILGGTAAPGSK